MQEEYNMNRMEILKKMQEGLCDPYKEHIKSYLDSIRHGGDNPMDIESVRKYFIELSGNHHYSANTIRLIRQAVKAGLRRVYRNESIDDRMRMEQGLKDLDYDVPPPKINSCQITKDQYLTLEEVEFLIEKARSRKQRAFIRFLFNTACRISELTGDDVNGKHIGGIRIEHCSRENGMVKIRLLGKGKKERYVKTTGELFDFVKDSFKGKEYLSETKNGKPYNRCYPSSQIKKLGWHVLNKSISAQTLRHSRIIAWLKENPEKRNAIMKYAGFSSNDAFDSLYGCEEMTDDMILNHEL